jgi:hypothetical protein
MISNPRHLGLRLGEIKLVLLEVKAPNLGRDPIRKWAFPFSSKRRVLAMRLGGLRPLVFGS